MVFPGIGGTYFEVVEVPFLVRRSAPLLFRRALLKMPFWAISRDVLPCALFCIRVCCFLGVCLREKKKF